MRKVRLCASIGFLGAFALWTVALRFIDVGEIGPEGTSVGFATLNALARDAVGVNMTLYAVTDWLGLVPLAVALFFAFVGLVQLVVRRSVAKVDRSIIAMGVFYISVAAAYLLFEELALNYRPILIEGRVEVSYPSSTTLLTLTVMPTAVTQLRRRVGRKGVFAGFTVAIVIFTAFMAVGRILSGVHWITDIIGGILLSVGLDGLYLFAADSVER